MPASLPDVLGSVSFLAALDAPAREALLAHCRRRRFGREEALFHEGDPGHSLYLILSGSVRIQRITPAGDLVQIARRGPGEAFGEMALIDGEPRMADAVTAEPTELLILNREGFVQCLRERPEVALCIMASLARRLREAGDHLASLQSQGVLGRLSAALLQLAEEDGSDEPGGGRRIAARLTQQGLALRIGSTRESVSRGLSEWKTFGAVRLDGRQIVITDRERLLRAAERP